MAKKTLHKPQTQLLKGINELCDAVTSTLGPYGSNVVLYRELNPPYSTKDGVTVAREITFKDPVKHMGAEMVKQASIETATKAGDGTTTTLVLAQALLNSALKHKVLSPSALKEQFNQAKQGLIEFIKPEYLVEEGNLLETISKIATISSNNDHEIASIITGIYKDLGPDALINITESKTGMTHVTKVPGMRFDNGWQHFKFVTNPTEMLCELEKPVILVTDYQINNLEFITNLLNACVMESKPLLIIAEDISPIVMKVLINVKTSHNLPICTVKTPAMNIRRTEMLQDIAALTGATFFSSKYGKKLSAAKLSDLGRAEKVIVDRFSTSIIDGQGKQEEIQARIDTINHQLKEVVTTDHAHYKKKLQERRACLSGGIAIIHVGGESEINMHEMKDRVDDAVCAVKAALEEGVCLGGGSVYWELAEYLAKKDKLNYAELILEQALREPLRKIWKSHRLFDIVSEQATTCDIVRYKKYLEQHGILDPVKVLKTALNNAISITEVILITDCVVYNDESPFEESLPVVDIDMDSKEDDGAI